MYYRINSELSDKMRVYKEKLLDVNHPAYGIIKVEVRSPWVRDYFKIENGNIKLITGRRDKKEFDGAVVEYPKGAKEISTFLDNNKDSLLAMNEELFTKHYKLNQHINHLYGELMGMDMTIEDYRKIMDDPPTPQQNKSMNRLWNERDKIIKQINKLEKKEKLLLSGKYKKKETHMER